MFNLTLHNIPGLLIAFIPALINLILIAYILFKLPKTRITNLFTLLTLCGIFWQINDSIARSISSAEAADKWDTVFSWAWIFVAPLCLHFTFLYTGFLQADKSRLYLTLLYIPAFIFIPLYQSHFYEHNFQQMPFWGWVNYHNSNIIDKIQIYWIASLVLASTIILFYKSFKVKNDKLFKYQSFFITSGIAIPTICGLITQVIFPTVLERSAIPVTSTFMTFFSLATVIALKRYKLFSISDLISTEVLIESMPVMVFSLNKQKRVTYINQFGLEVLGIHKTEANSLQMNQLLRYGSEEHAANMEEALFRTLKHESVENIESSLITPKGKISILISTRPIINNNQVEGALFTARDITELKKSHLLTNKNRELLEEAQQLSHIGSWEWSIKENTVLWSDEMYRIFGYFPGEIQLTYESFLENIHPEDKEYVKQHISKAIEDHKPFEFYHRISRLNRDNVIVHAQGKVTLDEENNILRMSGTGQDVTEVKHKEQVLKKQNEELQKINSELDKFVYSISHDLRAPLTSMLGIVAISEETTTDRLILEHLKLLRNSILKLDDFIRSILDYSLNSRLKVKKDEINFKEILDGVTRNLKYKAGASKEINILTNITANAKFTSDKTRVSIILNNLISNSIRYRNQETENPYVEINIQVNDQEAIISVSDNGIGIHKDHQDKVFNMFYRGSNSSVGSGLGLYIVKESVKKLNGNITLVSEFMKGANFIITLPNN